MTNEEALEVINRFGLDARGYPILQEAIDTAIQALEDKGYEQGYKDGYVKGYEEGVVLG